MLLGYVCSFLVSRFLWRSAPKELLTKPPCYATCPFAGLQTQQVSFQSTALAHNVIVGIIDDLNESGEYLLFATPAVYHLQAAIVLKPG